MKKMRKTEKFTKSNTFSRSSFETLKPTKGWPITRPNTTARGLKNWNRIMGGASRRSSSWSRKNWRPRHQMGVRGASHGRSQAGWRPATAVASGGRAVARLAEANKGMLALDNYNDKVCLFSCIEGHRGGGGGRVRGFNRKRTREENSSPIRTSRIGR